jgi:hypothetical protein
LTTESRRSQATQMSLAHPRVMTRREKWTIPSMRWNGHIAIRSTGPGRVNSMASWTAFAFSPQGKHKTRDCDRLQGLADEVFKMAKTSDQEKMPEDPKGDFPKAHKVVNYIFGGPNSYEPKRKQKLTTWEVMAVKPATPEYLRWYEVPITFHCGDHPDFIPKPGRYPLVVCPIVKDVKLNRVLVDGGSSLNLLFLKTFDQMRITRSLLRTSQAPFNGIVPSAVATPDDKISVLVIFGTRENFKLKPYSSRWLISRLRMTVSWDGWH